LSVPSGTTLRFGTLVTLAIGTTLYVFGQYASSWPVGTFSDDARCEVRANLYITSTGAVDPDESKWAVYRHCMAGLFLPRLAWLVGGLLALLAVSAAIYYARPAWRIRRSRLERLDNLPELWQKAPWAAGRAGREGRSAGGALVPARRDEHAGRRCRLRSPPSTAGVPRRGPGHPGRPGSVGL
jgi:hypothetical protein